MPDHLDPISFAQYLEGKATSDEKADWASHLSVCAECRQELIEAGRILATAPKRRRVALIPLAAAAAVLLVWLGTSSLQPSRPVTRDPETSPIPAHAPSPLAPLGEVARPEGMLWSAVPGAIRYRVTLFTVEGQAAWQTVSSDTFVALPDTLHLPVATAQYWQVKAETSFGRWVESELVGFTIRQADPAR